MIESLRIITLIDNTVAPRRGLRAEHGFAALVEADGISILFDTGQTDLIIHNARQLDLDLSRVNYIVLSHGHYDHTGGLPYIVALAAGARIIAHPDAFAAKYSCRSGEPRRYIGMPCQPDELSSLNVTLVTSREPYPIAPHIWTTGEIPRGLGEESLSRSSYVLTDRGLSHDPMLDDQALLIRTKRGVIVLFGCGHAGIENTLHRVSELSGESDILAIIGGLHLVAATQARLQKVVKVLKNFGVQYIIPGHCTGWKAMFTLAQEFSDGFQLNCVGATLTL